MKIKKGDVFLCKKDLITSDVLFVKGRTYISPNDWSILDDHGDMRAGWNRDTMDQHFEKVHKGFWAWLRRLVA